MELQVIIEQIHWQGYAIYILKCYPDHLTDPTKTKDI